jgi:hypothetical protein
MLRSILAVVVSYIFIFIVVAVGLTVAYLVLGTEGTFKPGVYEPTTAWMATMLGVGIVAAIAAGVLCAVVSKHSKGAVLGLLVVVIAMTFVEWPCDQRVPSSLQKIQSVSVKSP